MEAARRRLVYRRRMGRNLTGLDELLLTCRHPGSKAYLAEAIRCYNAGALRAAVVATWTAVVFDSVQKLKELEAEGSTEAVNRLQQLRTARKQRNLAQLQKLERTAIEHAFKPMELVSESDAELLNRIRDDRHKCAHPVFDDFEQAMFEPSAEQARAHIVHAVELFVSVPPMRGRHALEQLIATVGGPFPTDAGAAETVLGNTALAHARPPLIRNFVLHLTNRILRDGNVLVPDAKRLMAALLATGNLYGQVTQETLVDKLSPTMASAMNDERHAACLWFLSERPSSWELLDPGVRQRLRTAVLEATGERVVRDCARAIQARHLLAEALERLGRGTVADLAKVGVAVTSDELLAVLVERFCTAGSFATANSLAPAIVNHLDLLTVEQVRRIGDAVEENVDVRGAFGTMDLLRAIASSPYRNDLSDLVERSAHKDEESHPFGHLWKELSPGEDEPDAN